MYVSRLSKRYFNKYLKNPLIVTAVKDVLLKIRPLLESSWGEYSSTYSTYTYIDGKKQEEAKKYTISSALDEVEKNDQLKGIVESTLGFIGYGNRWFSSDNAENGSIYDLNSKKCKSGEDAVKIVDKAYQYVVEAEKQIKPKAKAKLYVRRKRKLQ